MLSVAYVTGDFIAMKINSCVSCRCSISSAFIVIDLVASRAGVRFSWRYEHQGLHPVQVFHSIGVLMIDLVAFRAGVKFNWHCKVHRENVHRAGVPFH